MADTKTLAAGLKEFSLDGKAALVIGAEHPVGRVAAITLAEAGAKVLIASQDAGTGQDLKEVAKAIGGIGGKPLIQVQRAALRADLSATTDLAVSKLGGLDILVTALDAPYYGPAESADDAVFDRVFEENFKTAWMAFQEGGRVMLKRGGGVIVNINSVLAERGVPNATLYCAAKGAVRNLVRALSLAWARRGIRLNMLECGWTAEEGAAALEGGDFSEAGQIPAVPALAQAEEIAGRCSTR
jgi:NAD(P)-dependent dehydrogenase (short-subunit alcohol dehydrogenase family)